MSFNVIEFLDTLFVHTKESEAASRDATSFKPPQTWAQKAAVLISGVSDGHLRAVLQNAFEERAAIAELDGGQLPDKAERLAFYEVESILAMWGGGEA